MSQFFSIKIPEPCSKDWNTMTPNEKGRFCNACSKTVIDFTKMNPFEIQDFINMNKEKSICGHIKQSQLDSINLQIPVQSINKELRSHKLFLYALLITMGTSLFSCITDDGNIKKIDSVEVVDTMLKASDSIAEKNCETIKDPISNNTTKTKDLKSKKTCKAKSPKIIKTTELHVEGMMIVEEIEPSNVTLEDPLIVGDIDYSYTGNLEEPFNVNYVDTYPEFTNTPKALTQEEKKEHFQKILRAFVSTNFNAPENLGINGKTKIYIHFKINTTGDITIIKSRSAHPRLEEEAKRVLHLLPTFKPAKHNNKTVSIFYNLPITINFD